MSITQADYNAIDAVNISTLKEIWSKSPLHCAHRLANPRESTKALLLGTATHMAVLEPLRFVEHYTVAPEGLDRRTKAGKAWWAEHDGEAILSADDYALCMAMSAAVQAHPAAAPYLDGGETEKVLRWTDEETGVECKGRVDLLRPDGALVGLKTARDADPRAFANAAAKYGYHLQFAYYHDALCALDQEPPEVVEIVVESKPPHDVTVYIIGPETIEAGRDEYRNALATLVECRERMHWPGRHPQPVVFDLPRWAVPGDDFDMSGLDMGGL